jgi:tetratricopeptide (TPR) repeat protein
MKKLFTAVIATVMAQFVLVEIAQAQLTVLPNGGNKRASVSEQIGLADVTIRYSRPHVNKREGHIWGELVPVGYIDQGFGTSKAAPWRAGANENTTIEFSTDVKIEGQPLAAGRYGFSIAYDPNECTLIFSKNSTSWGSFYYNPSEDALRVKVKPLPADKSVEWLKYEFVDETPSSAVVELEWEKLVIPFKIDVDVVNNQLTSFRKELRSNKGFTWQTWNQAALYCAQNKVNLEEALLWSDNAVGPNFGGSQSFPAWKTKAMLLDSLGRGAEATEIMKKALPFADEIQVYLYGNDLVNQKKGKEAFEIFKMNYDKHPDDLYTNVGMASGYSALGDYKKALPFAQKALPQAKGKGNTDAVEKAIKDLQNGRDMNLD